MAILVYSQITGVWSIESVGKRKNPQKSTACRGSANLRQARAWFLSILSAGIGRYQSFYSWSVMQYFTEKFHTKNSTRLNACNKWTLQSFYHKIIKAKQRKLYKRKKIWELITAWCYWRERFSLVSTAGFSSTLLSQFPYSWIMLPDRFFF